MQGVGKLVSLTQLHGLICFSWLYQCNLCCPTQFVLSFKVFVGELHFGEFRCRNSDAFSPVYFRA